MERRRDDTAGKERPAPKREELPVDDDDDEDTPTEDERRTKRPVAPSARKAGVGGPACQAEKCSADLSAAKRYHRRHKVCEHHSKAAVVVVAGLHQRFCQQCSRFHELSEFDETKRSCRRRLAGHNERRRKSSSETQGESSGRKGGGSQLKESHCRQGKISLPPGATLKHFQIR